MDQDNRAPNPNAYSALDRYRDVVAPFDAFAQSCREPLSACVWANELRISPEQLEERFQHHGAQYRRSRAFSNAFIFPPGFAPGSTPEYLGGLYHVQEEIALSAVKALDPQPGEKILDLCAAPGNKTAQIAVAMRNHGLLVANEVRHGRVSAMRFNLERLGVVNAVLTVMNGIGFPLEQGPFDRVLADVPCTCEGNVRRSTASGVLTPEHIRVKTVRTQEHLLVRALKLTKPGGILVYATCTFAPEENEGVIDSVLRHRGRVVPFEIPGLVSEPGLSSWQGRTFREDVRHAQRYYPHHNDTGGFFVARIERLDT